MGIIHTSKYPRDPSRNATKNQEVDVTHSQTQRLILLRSAITPKTALSAMKFATIAFALFAAPGIDAFVPESSARFTTSLPSYLDDLSAKKAASPRKGISSYLDTVSTAPARAGGAGIGNYLNSVSTGPVRTGGAGISNYLDTVNQACDSFQPDTTKCAEAISDYMGALSSGHAP